MSARGLAIDVAEPSGEEFPVFRRFWIERPSGGEETLVVHALLDSPRVTGAHRFDVRPGAPTRLDVQATLFPRENLAHVGLAPLTSMFLHGGPANRSTETDYRPAVHDSEGLAIERGNGERVWRPLSNPGSLQVSAFIDETPRSFGLIQRSRSFAAYQDLEARYERRPSSWVEPLGSWGSGELRLVDGCVTAEPVTTSASYLWFSSSRRRMGMASIRAKISARSRPARSAARAR